MKWHKSWLSREYRYRDWERSCDRLYSDSCWHLEDVEIWTSVDEDISVDIDGIWSSLLQQISSNEENKLHQTE